MKKLVLVFAVVMSAVCAEAKGLKLVAQQRLTGHDGIDVHLVMKKNGQMIIHYGRSMPVELKIQDIQDQRDGDGNLEIALSNGMKLIQTSGFTVDHRIHIYMQKPNGERFEMLPQVELKMTK